MRFYRLRDAIEAHKEGNEDGGKGETGSASPKKANGNGKDKAKGKGKGKGGAETGKGKKRKLSEVEDGAEEDGTEGVDAKDEN